MADSKESKEVKETKSAKKAVIKSEKTEVAKAPKAKKEKKTVEAKKLPGLYKKKYTEKSLEKKILGRIYIEADRKKVGNLFNTETDKKGRAFLCIDKTAKLSKDDFTRFKLIAKDIQANKAGFKLVPFLAVVCLLAAIGIVVTLFKNIVVEKGVASAMQNIFQAKTDIEKVDVQIFGASLEIKGLQQANKDSPMKNLFQIDKIHVDFDLTDLLRGKFHAENVEVSGVALDTERKKSGELLVKTKNAETKAAEKKVAENTKSLNEAAAEQLKEMFANYNPETMLAGIQNELKSPALANSITSEVQAKVAKWQNVPNEYQTSIDSFRNSVEKLTKTNWGNVSDPAVIKDALENIDRVYKEGNSLKSKISSTANDIKTDGNAVKDYSNQIQAAIKSDTALVDTKVKEMKATFSPAGMKKIMQDAVQSVLYQVTGKYYPYIQKVMDAARSAQGSGSTKSESKAKKSKKAGKTGHARSNGRTVYYRKDTVPKLLIENVKASGYEYQTNSLLFQGTATDISSDQNMYGKPAVVNADFKIMGKNNNANVVIDARDNSNAKLVTAKYSGKGYPISANAQVFNVSSDSDISAVMTADSDGTFVIGGTLDMHVKEMSGMEFSPAKVSELYNNAIRNISALTIGFNIGYDGKEGIVCEITNMDKLANQLVAPITAALTTELNSIANDATRQITAMLNEKTGGATDAIARFTGIQNSVNGQINTVNDLQKQLEKQKKEFSSKATNAATNAAKDAAGSMLKKLF